MNHIVSDETQKLLQECMKKGGYQHADDAVRAGLIYLRQHIRGGEFAPRELTSLLAEADTDIDNGNLIDGEEVFREIREMGKRARKW